MPSIALPGLPTTAAFVAACLVLALTPGPAVLYLVARTLRQGARVGLASVAAVAVGNLGNALAATFGLAALFATSSVAFTVVKIAGAGYLVWLGIGVLRARPVRGGDADAAAPLRADGAGRAFRDGLLVALLNPKTTLFFAAFLPQFIDPAGSVVAQSLALGMLFTLVAAITDIGYVLLSAGLVRPLARQGRRLVGAGGTGRGRYAVASVYFGLGAWAALAERPTVRR